MAEDNRNKPLYMISVAAELTGMHPQTLRVYESKGLVNPSARAVIRVCIRVPISSAWSSSTS